MALGVIAAAMSDRLSSDSQLVRRAQNGDAAAFEQLFIAYQGRIYALCLRMMSDPSRAEDLTSCAWTSSQRLLPPRQAPTQR